MLQLPSWYLPQGGHFVRYQSMALREQGVDVAILANVTMPWRAYIDNAFNGRYPLRPFWSEEDGIPVLRHYFRPLPKCEIPNIRLWALQTAQLYEHCVARFGHPDIIHVHSSTWGAYAASLIKQKWGTPYVVTEHRGMFGCKSQLARDFFIPAYEPFFREGFSHADFIIPVGDSLIPKIREYLTQDVPIQVVSNIVDTDFFVPGSEVKPLQPFRWISVNGYYPVKGYDILLPAFDRLCDQDAEVSLTLVGENFEQEAFQTILRACRHRERIRFTGELDREGVRRELQAADAFVMSSRVEAQPIAILEALSGGLPVAGTEVIPSYTLPEDLGIRVPIERPDLLADAMQQVMDHYADYDAKKAHAHALRIAHKSVVAKQLISIYTQVIQKAQ